MKRFTIQERITQRDCDSLDMYLKEINGDEYNPLTSEEEVELSIKIKQGDKRALDKLVKANLRFAVSVAKAYQGQGLPLSDLINESNIGLINSAQKFDETRGFKFISYAVWWLRQSILKAIAEKGKIIRLPMNQVNNTSKIAKAKIELSQKMGREPSTAEIAELLALEESEVILVNDYRKKAKSLSSPLNDEESSTLEDLVEDTTYSTDSSLMMNSLQREISDALSQFSPRDREIIELSFGLGRDYPMDDEEIAEKYNLTRERIRQIKKTVSRTLASNDSLRSFLG